MNFFSERELRSIAAKAADKNYLSEAEAQERLTQSLRDKDHRTYDIFLSYGALDWAIVFGLYSILKDNRLSVYVDRIEDPLLDARHATPAIAEIIRKRMTKCSSMLFATGEHLSPSRLLPWEVGFFDGLKGKVAIVPVTQEKKFMAHEFLGLYPILESDSWLCSPDGSKTLTTVSKWIRA
jgi:hypothetical protein